MPAASAGLGELLVAKMYHRRITDAEDMPEAQRRPTQTHWFITTQVFKKDIGKDSV